MIKTKLKWFDCRYCGREFQSIKKRIYCPICLSRFTKEPLPKCSTTMRMLRNREFLKKYRENQKCEICGYNKYPEILQFHHKHKNEKIDTVCNLAKTLKSIYNIKKEIDKCMLLCPNCHREMHLGDKSNSWVK